MAEKRAEELQRQLNDIETRLGDESLYKGNLQKSRELLQERAQLRTKLKEAENLWLEKTTELENQSI